ncbi:3'-5' exoribonuclease [Mesorhizobium sp. BR1-1-16]|uniref:3'-5' exoribonuclease domain-containing protein n=1 Tax=Mesorhizobium sp. BR1-1-16 TaxID=2876653 RepID=UPI001CCA2086|nr:3'-5' exoribonuclease [Mesorhizobium sp. BR1-1-16]MBZ9939184.1 3'-5' exoribonuclease [Mesorhizobium sp. BR1-1-16]
MRIWFDTEFIEDGKTIDLVSIGMAREDGATYYAECAEADLSRCDDWFTENVIPHLTGIRAPRRQIAADIVAFAGTKPEFWAYYSDYDWVCLCQLYGRMIDLPDGWPMFCLDLKQMAVAFGSPKLPEQASVEHNALTDAVWTREAWDFLHAKTAGPAIAAAITKATTP